MVEVELNIWPALGLICFTNAPQQQAGQHAATALQVLKRRAQNQPDYATPVHAQCLRFYRKSALLDDLEGFAPPEMKRMPLWPDARAQ